MELGLGEVGGGEGDGGEGDGGGGGGGEGDGGGGGDDCKEEENFLQLRIVSASTSFFATNGAQPRNIGTIGQDLFSTINHLILNILCKKKHNFMYSLNTFAG